MKTELLELLVRELISKDSDSSSNISKPQPNAHEKESPYEIGKSYHVRTVTMAISGTLKSVFDNELVFENASWVADTGRFNEYLKDTEKVKENETFPNDVILGRGSIVDCTLITSSYYKVK